ncbi:MAG: hypothetical protein BWY15_02089 [Firmicutes bacterium ADurb.Bin193]|nr:MAG: hypothetical protein BWY15_02089 [Firmicutes bacterium ADurb.Bin193]
MAITTLDGALAGMQWPRYIAKNVTGTMVGGRPWSLWALGGNPGAGSFDNTLAGVALTAPVNGQIPFTNPVSGNTYLARLQAAASQAGTLLLCDRLWHNGGFTITSNTAQTVNSATWPARDADGATDGNGVILGLEISASAGAAAPTITVSYTNQGGTASRTATVVSENVTVFPQAGNLTLTGVAPAFEQSVLVTPETTSLILSGNRPDPIGVGYYRDNIVNATVSLVGEYDVSETLTRSSEYIVSSTIVRPTENIIQ